MRPSFYISREITLRTELKNYIGKADSLGYIIPDYTGRIALNTLIIAMANCGFWQTQDLILNLGFNNTECNEIGFINMKKVTDPLAVAYGGLTYEANGYLGNAIDGYIDTNYNASTYGGNYTTYDCGRGIIVYKTGVGLFGKISSGNVDRLLNNNSISHCINTNGFLTSKADMRGTGLKSINRIGGYDVVLYNKNIELIRNQWVYDVTNDNDDIFYSGYVRYSNAGGSIYWAGGSNSNSMTQSFRTAYNTYLTSIGLLPIA